MVKVQFKYNNKQQIISVKVKGHANFKKHGEDIVCAGISAITVGIINTLDQMNLKDVTSTANEGNVEIAIPNPNTTTNTILKTMYYQLLTIMEQYPKYIKIKEV